ncbi:Enoyl-[acyl-carrier-protein] reductase [NADH], chloroplastic [Orobanche gracilis]
MAAFATPGTQIATPKPCISASSRISRSRIAHFGHETKGSGQTKLSSLSLSATQLFSKCYDGILLKSERHVIKATSGTSDKQPLPGLPIDLRGVNLGSDIVLSDQKIDLTIMAEFGAQLLNPSAVTSLATSWKRAFVAGIADDNGYGWAIAKSLAAAGAEILVGTWVPALNIFEWSLSRGKFDESRVLPDGSLMEITKVYPLDAVFDCPEDVPEDIKTNKRYAGSSDWTVKEVAETVKKDFGTIDILVHSLANGPEVTKPLLETSRNGYLAAISASSYSFVSLLKHFLPIMNPGGATISLTYIASEKIIPGYGGGMSSAKSALESDTRVLAFEAGRKHNIRVNTISAGPLRSRAAKAIGFIDMMIDYSSENASLQKELTADEVGNAAAFLASPLASAITGAVVYVDNGLNAMGVGVDSPVFRDLDIPKANKS